MLVQILKKIKIESFVRIDAHILFLLFCLTRLEIQSSQAKKMAHVTNTKIPKIERTLPLGALFENLARPAGGAPT